MALQQPIGIRKKGLNCECPSHRHHRNLQMPRVTYKTIITRQVEQFLVSASLLELILDTDASDGSDSVETEVRAR